MTMNTRQAAWYKVQPEVGWGTGIKIGMCAVVIGLFCVVAQNGRQEAATMPADTNERIAANTGKPENGSTKIQAAIDASPVFGTEHGIKPVVPATVVPSKKPSLGKRALSRVDVKKVDVAGTMPSGVLRFDRCVPKCETQDPLFAGYSGPSPDPVIAQSRASDAEDVGFDLSPLQRAGDVLGRTAAMPRAALRKGRDIIYGIIRSD